MKVKYLKCVFFTICILLVFAGNATAGNKRGKLSRFGRLGEPSFWNNVKKVRCKPGYYNVLKVGGGLAGGSEEDILALVCQPCTTGRYCPGNGYEYKCPSVTKEGAITCPESSAEQ